MSGIIRKSIFHIFVLRVSGKGDVKGSLNQLEVLKSHLHRPGVAWLLENFDPLLMRASSARGRRLREEWHRLYGLEVLSRAGRSDFLGVTVVVDGTRFVLYASTAAQMDEASGNAFTRHLIRFLKEPAFTGHADHEFAQRRDEGLITDDHPSLCTAFDVTRFVRSMEFASQLWEAARFARAAFDVKEIRVDPEGGEGQQMMWNFLAYGSQMEAQVGKMRRFVGKLNDARAGYFPNPEGFLPLGFRVGAEKPRALQVQDADIESVSALCRLGLTALSYPDLAETLGGQYGVRSTDPKTRGVKLHELGHPEDAVKRLFMTRKLHAYRDGAYEMVFAGVLPNRFRPGSGHVLTRRWQGHDEHGRHDEYGQIAYTIPAPKPTVLDHTGQARPGWIAGVSAEQEHEMWTRLIEQRGRSEKHADNAPAAGTPLHDSAAARSGARREETMALSRLCVFRDADAGVDGPRTKLFPRTGSGPEASRYELRRERCTPTREGIKYQSTALVASWPDFELRGYVAALLRRAVSRLLDEGHHLGPLEVTLPKSVVDDLSGDSGDGAARAVGLREEARAARAKAEGYEQAEAEERILDEPDGERLASLQRGARELRAKARQFEKEAEQLREVRKAPSVDFGMVRDVIAALEGAYARGLAPRGLNEALHLLLPEGLRFLPGPDSVTLSMTATIALPLQSGGSLTAAHVLDVPFAARQQAGENGQERVGDLAARYMRDGHTLEQVAGAARMQAHHLLPLIKNHVAGLAARTQDRPSEMAEGATGLALHWLPTILTSPIPETRALAWQWLAHPDHELSGVGPGYVRAVHDAYFQADSSTECANAAGERAEPVSRTPSSRLWAWDANSDHRRELQTILHALPGPRKAMSAQQLADALGASGDIPGPLRHVHTSSVPIERRSGVYPATLTRVLRGEAGTWGRQASIGIPASDKMIELLRCPHLDCPERYATAIVLAAEVLRFGTGNLCRRCKRPAVDTPAAKVTVFPDSVIAWSDNQPTRSGSWQQCAAPGCSLDVNAGPGMAWKWDDRLGDVWHNEHCRTGSLPPSTYRPCQYQDCAIDEGEGPGSLDIGGQRSSRRWHTRTCEHAEERRLRRAARGTRSAPCGWTGCNLDNGAGPGVIAGVHHAQKVHADAECKAGWKRGERRT